jgi:hypothetical protein
MTANWDSDTNWGWDSKYQDFLVDFLQILTPPISRRPSPVLDSPSNDSKYISVSTAFHAGANLHLLPPDVTLLSSDSVHFYVHSHILLGASDNSFRSLLLTKVQSPDTSVPVPELSPVLNIILHIIYNMAFTQYSFSLDTLSDAVNCLSLYGVHPKLHVVRNTPVYALLLSLAPLFPIRVYTLAAKYNIDDLAVTTSSHLLSLELWTLTDEIVEEMGPIYLRRLFFLHLGRVEALKRLSTRFGSCMDFSISASNL